MERRGGGPPAPRDLLAPGRAPVLALCLALHAAPAYLAADDSTASSAGHSAGRIPGFVDCTDRVHGDWARFRRLFRAAAGGGFPGFEPELAKEAVRLHGKWYGQLPRGQEDYPPGSAAFYHSCHWHEASPYCLYGHVAVLAYLARHGPEGQRYAITRLALRLLHWNHCLDFLESSSWGFTVLDIWDSARGFDYPQITMLHQSLEFGSLGPGTGKPARAEPHQQSPASPGAADGGKPGFWVFEFGIHRALSNEPLSMLRHVLPRHEVLHQNFLKPYEGGADAFRHPFPRECSPNCQYQQDSVPYTFPVFEGIRDVRRGWLPFFTQEYLRKPEVRRASIFLCTNPIYQCSLFAGFNRTIIGYFGLPLLYMVPHDDWDQWVRDFIALAVSPQSLFLANNPLLAEQVAWQSGVRLRVLRPVAFYIRDAYYPSRGNDVLVPEPREACVLTCLLKAFTPPDFPFRFLTKADTDRAYRTFATFRAVVLFPHDIALMSFYEFYAMAIPLFLPSHLSKYLFPYSATVPLLDWVPKWIAREGAPGCGGGNLTACGARPAHSPISLTTVAALEHWSKYIDFFILPAVQLFASIAALMDVLPAADMHEISVRMRSNRNERLVEAMDFWEATAAAAMLDGASAASS